MTPDDAVQIRALVQLAHRASLRAYRAAQGTLPTTFLDRALANATNELADALELCERLEWETKATLVRLPGIDA